MVLAPDFGVVVEGVVADGYRSLVMSLSVSRGVCRWGRMTNSFRYCVATNLDTFILPHESRKRHGEYRCDAKVLLDAIAQIRQAALKGVRRIVFIVGADSR